MGVGEEGVAATEGEIVGGVEGEELADVGGGGAVVEVRERGDGDEGGCVGGDRGVPGGAVVKVFGPGVVGADVETVVEVGFEIDDEGVVVAGATGPP